MSRPASVTVWPVVVRCGRWLLVSSDAGAGLPGAAARAAGTDEVAARHGQGLALAAAKAGDGDGGAVRADSGGGAANLDGGVGRSQH